VAFVGPSLPVATIFMYCTAQTERGGEIRRRIVAFPSPSRLREVFRGSAALVRMRRFESLVL